MRSVGTDVLQRGRGRIEAVSAQRLCFVLDEGVRFLQLVVKVPRRWCVHGHQLLRYASNEMIPLGVLSACAHALVCSKRWREELGQPYAQHIALVAQRTSSADALPSSGLDSTSWRMYLAAMKQTGC